VVDGGEEGRIEPPNAGQGLGIDAVTLGVVLRDEPQPPRIGHEHLVPARLE
jgi:hypothetical protein